VASEGHDGDVVPSKSTKTERSRHFSPVFEALPDHVFRTGMPQSARTQATSKRRLPKRRLPVRFTNIEAGGQRVAICQVYSRRRRGWASFLAPIDRPISRFSSLRAESAASLSQRAQTLRALVCTSRPTPQPTPQPANHILPLQTTPKGLRSICRKLWGKSQMPPLFNHFLKYYHFKAVHPANHVVKIYG
jgi:hypothetical protein